LSVNGESETIQAAFNTGASITTIQSKTLEELDYTKGFNRLKFSTAGSNKGTLTMYKQGYSLESI